MRLYRLAHCSDNIRQVLRAVEDDESRFRVSPHRILQELFVQFLIDQIGLALPNQTLRNEDVPIADSDENICLASPVEGFSRYSSFVNGIQANEEYHPNVFLFHFRK